jgi:hypothetical protein
MNHVGYSSKELPMNPKLNCSLDKQTFEFSLIPIIYGMERELNLSLFIQILSQMISNFPSKSEIIPMVEKTFFSERTIILDSFLDLDNQLSKGLGFHFIHFRYHEYCHST